jgi:hypothetical protein
MNEVVQLSTLALPRLKKVNGISIDSCDSLKVRYCCFLIHRTVSQALGFHYHFADMREPRLIPSFNHSPSHIGIQSISFPALTQGSVAVYNNELLSTVDLPALYRAGTLLFMDNNQLSTLVCNSGRPLPTGATILLIGQAVHDVLFLPPH